MTLETYIQNLLYLCKSNPILLNKEVVYSVDDEGNQFNKMVFDPSAGILDSSGSYDAINLGEEPDKLPLVNAVCIN